ncbi:MULTISPECIES: ScbR family autoregulator-binding transcription factor [unclassified Streptomyces]|uniref:ScbR family autoregulator-binding transcription factor n=1 Tax=unclassified Streptomyces TaxID=2593676 RepID=UPI00166126AB|nr:MULTISPECIES: ScbR family autoregulator-binding transcription factor [unclassified Streptomyces]MBD0711172.1 gamma-butyrolactone-binding protein [Streptomyces sp. CBMA291]MBD0714203.1 gamma-butyrolactone-binding protein [Streptomyces sp. CBMA370]
MKDRAAKTRRQLIRSTAELFDRSGFAGTSVGQICALAQVSQGALHFHFGNKHALGQAVEATAAEILTCVIGPVPARHPAPLQLLVDTSHVLARRVSQDPLLRAGFGLARDPAWPGGTSPWQLWREWVRGLLRLARRQGCLTAGVDLDGAVTTITAVTAGLEGLQRAPDRAGATQSVTPFWRLVLPQLAAEGVRGRIDPAGACPLELRRFGPGGEPEECPVTGAGELCRSPLTRS